jgi:hypothetical protein
MLDINDNTTYVLYYSKLGGWEIKIINAVSNLAWNLSLKDYELMDYNNFVASGVLKLPVIPS